MRRRDSSTFPFLFEEVENAWIPMPDGARLAARLWIPEQAATTPVPVLVEYIPYRKRDGTRERDEAMHRYFAGHGYAAARVDLRGSGDSDGVLLDEYLDQEIDDGVEVIAWLAAQPWCNGRVGMIGKSWGGFNALQIASRRPAALGATIVVCAADDRFTDDAHYMGGALLNENQVWGSVLFTLQAQPPDPAIVGERWRRMWLERLAGTRPPPITWLAHPARDDYWRRGSVCEDYAAVRCPVYAVGGWADAYSNAVPRLVEHLSAPCKGLIGPWGHLYPHQGVPGPAIGFLQEALRWWDHWLGDVDNGIMQEPRLRVWMPSPVSTRERETPGRWVAERTWPSRRIVAKRYYLGGEPSAASATGATNARTLSETPLPPSVVRMRSPQDTGLDAGRWCPFGRADLPAEQSRDDAKSVCFDSAPLTERLELLGAVDVVLTVIGDEPAGLVAARLNAVGPDGYVTRITYGLLNLELRNGDHAARPMPIGEPVTITIRLNHAACSLEPGSRLRLSVSTAYWPIAWPAAAVKPVRLLTEQSYVSLPIRPSDPTDAALPEFEPPESARIDPVVDLHAMASERSFTVDPESGTTRLTSRSDVDEQGRLALWRYEAHGLIAGFGSTSALSIDPADPCSATTQYKHVARIARDDWSAAVETDLVLTADAEAFRLRASLRAIENDSTTVFERAWDETIARRARP